MANSPILSIPLLSTSQAAKETTINTMVAYLERSMNDAITIALAGGNYTITDVDLKRYFNWKFTGAGGASEITITPAKRMFVVDNLANATDLTLKAGAATMTIPAGAVVVCMVTTTPSLIRIADTTITGGGSGATNFVGLSDTFPAYTDLGKFVLRVKEDLTGIEAHELALADLADVDLSGLANGHILQWDAVDSKFEAVAPSSGGGGPTMVAQPCRIATFENIDPVLDLFPGNVIDGITIEQDDRVLIKNQDDGFENGIWVVGETEGAKAADMDDLTAIAQGLEVFVLEGDLNGRSLWVLETLDAVVGSSVLTFVKPKAGTFEDLLDYDAGVPPTANMVLVYNDGTEKWTPTITSTTLPAGGTSGQALVKNSSTDYDWTFKTLTPAGGTTGQVLAKSSDDDYDTQWVDSSATLREFTGTTDTALLADAGNIIGGDNVSAITATIPPNSDVAYPVGTTLTWWNKGVGLITLAAGSGVTLTAGPDLTLTAYGQNSMIAAVKVATDTWIASGNFGAA